MKDMDLVRILVLKALGAKGRPAENRFLLQKKAYLAQSFGVDLLYAFAWFPHGPFSAGLHDLLTGNTDFSADDQDLRSMVLRSETVARIECVNALAKKNTMGFPEYEWYELLASVAFIKDNSNSWHAYTKNETFLALKTQKPLTSRSAFEAAWVILEETQK